MIDEEIIKEVEAKKIVLKVLEADMRARNSDKWLLLKVWQEQGLPDSLIKELENHLPLICNPESIRRSRQIVQNTEGKYLPSDPSVIIKRKIKESILRKYYANNQQLLNEYQEMRYGIK